MSSSGPGYIKKQNAIISHQRDEDLTIERGFLIHTITQSKAGGVPKFSPSCVDLPQDLRAEWFCYGDISSPAASCSPLLRLTTTPPAPLETLPFPSASTPPAHPSVGSCIPAWSWILWWSQGIRMLRQALWD